MLFIRLLLLGLISGHFGFCADRTTLCEIFDHLKGYASKRVILHGELHTGYEATEFRARDCTRGPHVKEYIFVPALSVTFLPAAREHWVYKTILAKSEAEHIKSGHYLNDVRVEVEGELLVKPNLNAYLGPRDRWMPDGVGHLNQYPAELLIRRIIAYTLP